MPEKFRPEISSSDAERDRAIQEKLKELFETDTEKSPVQRGVEFGRLLKSTEKIIESQAKKGEGKIGATIPETFAGGKIDKVQRDGYFYAIPKQENGQLIAVTDIHGDTTALKKAVEEFLADENSHLVSMGDMIAGKGSEQVKVVEVLMKLFNEYPDRVHLLRGNCEIDVSPQEGFGDQLYEAQKTEGWRLNTPRAQRIFNKMPVGLITENGIVGVHGCLPRPVKEKGTLHYRNLEEINGFSDYQSDPTKFAGREVRRMVWGDIDTEAETGYAGERFYVSSAGDVQNQLDAVGGKVLIRGHQSKILKKVKRGVSIDVDGKVGTFHSSHKGPDRRILHLPLDQEVTELTEDMFEKVE